MNTQDQKNPTQDDPLADIFGEDPPSYEFFIPIHDFVWFSEREKKIIDHPAFQRLGNIYQLGQAHYVYRGATHTRLEHCLGTVHMAQYLINSIRQNHNRIAYKIKDNDKPLSENTFSIEEVAFIRLAALLHDIGHIAAGHTLEDELGLLNKHESEKRLTLIFDKKDWLNTSFPSLREIIDDEYALVKPCNDLSPTEVLFLLICKDKISQVIKSTTNFKINVCRDIVGNTICADFIDYIHRDWYHVGKPRYFDTRLFQYFELRENDGKCQIVISIGNKEKKRTDAISAITSLLDSRYQLAESVLFHKTKCVAAAMLERGVQELRSNSKAEWSSQLEEKMLRYSDLTMLKTFIHESKEISAANKPLSSLEARKLYSIVYSSFHQDIEDSIERLHEIYNNEINKNNKLRTVRMIEADFGLPSGSVVMYFPAKSMNAKIPQVQIYTEGVIKTFEKWNEEYNDKLDGGHIKAQILRFKRLWRAYIAIDKNELNNMTSEKRELLINWIKNFVFKTDTQSSGEQLLIDSAKNIKDMPMYGKKKVTVLANRGKISVYPLGNRSLLSYYDLENE